MVSLLCGLQGYDERGCEINFSATLKNSHDDMSLSWWGKKAKGTPAARSGFMGRNKMVNMQKSLFHSGNARGRRRARRFNKIARS